MSRYAMTNLRLMMDKGGKDHNFRDFSWAMVPDIVLIESANGRGTIVFGDLPPLRRNQSTEYMPGCEAPEFFEIAQARTVYDLARQAWGQFLAALPPHPGPSLAADDLFAARLLPGETIRWMGKPGQGLIFHRRDRGLLGVGVGCLGASIGVTLLPVEQMHVDALIRGYERIVLLLFGLVYAAAGAHLLLGRNLVDARRRRDTRYAVTDYRVLFARPAPSNSFTSLSLATFAELNLIEHPDGRGTIIFGPVFGFLTGPDGSHPYLPVQQFVAIEDARHVYEILQQTRLAYLEALRASVERTARHSPSVASR